VKNTVTPASASELAAKVTLPADVIQRSDQGILTMVFCRPLLPRSFDLYIY
jgi:hypothetical protein